MPIDKSRKPSPEGQGDQSRQSREQKEQKPLNNETPDERLQRHTRFLRTATNGSTDSPSSSYYRTEQRAESNDRRQKDKFNRDSNTWADQMDYRINTTKMWNDRAYDNRSQIRSKDINVDIIKERSRNNGDIEVTREQYFRSGDTGIKKDSRHVTREILFHPSQEEWMNFGETMLNENPEKIFPDKGPKNENDRIIAWSILKELSGNGASEYNEHERYPELKEWIDNEAAKQSRAKRIDR